VLCVVQRAIEGLKGNDDKIRVVLNKADMVSHQQLMRVYGAMMWSLGKVVKTPEVMRVYIGTSHVVCVVCVVCVVRVVCVMCVDR
jgi:hypothetical protein